MSLRCNVCGAEPFWSLPRPGDPCFKEDGGTMVVVAECRAPVEITTDHLWPRDNPEYRFRIYGQIRGDLDVLAAAPDWAGVGVALGTLHEDMQRVGKTINDLGRIGVLDVAPDGVPSENGEWVVLPFDRGPHI